MYLRELIAQRNGNMRRLKTPTAPRIIEKTNCQQKRSLSMSKSEELVAAALHEKYNAGEVIAQQVRNLFMLAGGVMYIPDFMVFRPDGIINVIEVKGGYRGAGFEQGEERYKSAAVQYSKAPFFFSLWRVNTKERTITIEQWNELQPTQEAR